MKRSVTKLRGAPAWSGRAWRTAALMAALTWCGQAAAEEPAVPAPAARSEQVGPSSHVIVDAAAGNAGFVVTATSVVVIGTPATAAAASRWLEVIRAVSPKPVSHLLLTGYEPEQGDGVAALKANGAAIVARRMAVPPAPAAAPRPSVPPVTPTEAPAPSEPVSGEPPAPSPPAAFVAANLHPLAADLWLDDSTDLLFGGVHLQALALAPVHGPHEMAYAVPDDGVVYAGELYVGGRLPDVRDADATRWIEALAELQRQGAGVLVPARGAASREPQADLQRLRDYLGALIASMGEAARSRTPFDEAYASGDWSRWAELPMFEAVHRANARHTYLQAQGPAN